MGPTYNLKIGKYYSVVIWKRSRAILSNLMPMVVKIVGSTPTARTIDESEVVGVLDTEQNKQIYETGRRVQTLRFAKELQSRSTVTGYSKGNITAEKCTYCRSRRNKAQSNRGASKGILPTCLSHFIRSSSSVG